MSARHSLAMMLPNNRDYEQVSDRVAGFKAKLDENIQTGMGRSNDLLSAIFGGKNMDTGVNVVEIVTGDVVSSSEEEEAGRVIMDRVDALIPLITGYMRDIGLARIYVAKLLLEHSPTEDEEEAYVVVKVTATESLAALEDVVILRLAEWTAYFAQRAAGRAERDAVGRALAVATQENEASNPAPDGHSKSALTHLAEASNPALSDLAEAAQATDRAMTMALSSCASDIVAGYYTIRKHVGAVERMIKYAAERRAIAQKIYN